MSPYVNRERGCIGQGDVHYQQDQPIPIITNLGITELQQYLRKYDYVVVVLVIAIKLSNLTDLALPVVPGVYLPYSCRWPYHRNLILISCQMIFIRISQNLAKTNSGPQKFSYAQTLTLFHLFQRKLFSIFSLTGFTTFQFR